MQAHDAAPGWDVSTEFKDNVDGVAVIQRQDAEPYLENNKAQFNSGHDGYTPSRCLKKVADIPMGVYLLWLELYGVDLLNKNHATAVRRLLNDPEWRHLRTAPGRL